MVEDVIDVPLQGQVKALRCALDVDAKEEAQFPMSFTANSVCRRSTTCWSRVVEDPVRMLSSTYSSR